MADSAAAVERDAHGPAVPPPTVNAHASVVATMVLARLGIMFGLGTPIVAGLALKIQDLVPKDDVVATLGLITSLGAFAALFFDPVFGRISDRTTSRFGRRRPWMIAGAVGLLASLAIMALAPNVFVLGAGWVLGQSMANAAVAAHTASLADQLPTSQRGMVGGAVGIANQAAFLGAAQVASLFTEQLLLVFLIPGVVGLLLVLLYAVVLPDQQLTRAPRGERGFVAALKTFWVNPVRHPDFAYAWISRFLVVLANFMFVTFRLLWLQHELGLEKGEAAKVMATGVLCFTVALVVSGQIAGWLSDRLGRRKIFIVSSAIVFAVGTYLLTQATSTTGFFLAEVVIGIGFGIYVAVDLALVLDVLPHPDDAGKDLGVFNIAMAGPQVLAAGLAAFIIGLGGGDNYDLMLTVAAGLGLLGAVLILPVKKVR